MFSMYFLELEKQLIKKYRLPKNQAKKGLKASEEAEKKDLSDLTSAVASFSPSRYSVQSGTIVDSSGLRINDADFFLVDNIFGKTASIFQNGYPLEVIGGTFTVCEQINRKQLLETLVSAANSKKAGYYSDVKKSDLFVPSFVIAFESTYLMEELKKAISEIYRENSVDPGFEFDIMLVLGTGIVIKDWNKKGNFIALDTKEDSLKWFFIIMNEYLGLVKRSELDLRTYIANPKLYDEY